MDEILFDAGAHRNVMTSQHLCYNADCFSFRQMSPLRWNALLCVFMIRTIYLLYAAFIGIAVDVLLTLFFVLPLLEKYLFSRCLHESILNIFIYRPILWKQIECILQSNSRHQSATVIWCHSLRSSSLTSFRRSLRSLEVSISCLPRDCWSHVSTGTVSAHVRSSQVNLCHHNTFDTRSSLDHIAV